MTLIPQADLISFMSYNLGVGKTSIARSIARALNRQVLWRQGLLFIIIIIYYLLFMFYCASTCMSHDTCGEFGEHNRNLPAMVA